MFYSEIIALSALILALITAFIQIKVHMQSLRPFLSFGGTNGIIRIFEETGVAGIDFNIRLMNVGNNVLRYEVLEFDVYLNDVKLPDVVETSTGSIIGVNTEISHNRFYNNILAYKKGLSPEQYTPPNHKICFSIEYYRVNKTKKKYRLSYEVFVSFDSGIKREIYGKTFAN
jgi:hypothetical protein